MDVDIRSSRPFFFASFLRHVQEVIKMSEFRVLTKPKNDTVTIYIYIHIILLQ